MRPAQLVRTLTSLVLYAGIYYLIFRDARSIAFLLAVIVIHESGHFIAMKSFGYNNVKMFFIPLFGAFVSGKAAAFDPGKKMIVLLAGPLPGILLGMASAFLYSDGHQHFYYTLALMFIFLNVFNLLPLTPMDGGQMLEVLFPSYSKWVQTIFVLFSSLALGFLAYWFESYLIVLLIILMWFRITQIWRNKVTREAENSLNLRQSFLFTLIWLAFIILPMITLYKIIN